MHDGSLVSSSLMYIELSCMDVGGELSSLLATVVVLEVSFLAALHLIFFGRV